LPARLGYGREEEKKNLAFKEKLVHQLDRSMKTPLGFFEQRG
jgi:hypothetical protein